LDLEQRLPWRDQYLIEDEYFDDRSAHSGANRMQPSPHFDAPHEGARFNLTADGNQVTRVSIRLGDENSATWADDVGCGGADRRVVRSRLGNTSQHGKNK